MKKLLTLAVLCLARSLPAQTSQPQTPTTQILALSRNLRLMQSNGWIEPAGNPAANKDRRERGYRLTPAGQALPGTASPAWNKAQDRLRCALSGHDGDAMWNSFRKITAAVQSALAGESS